MKITHLLIFGKVQGIGFRNFVRHNGRKLGLVGWVRNLPARNAVAEATAGGPEGTVEAEVSGQEKDITKLIALCRKGPFLAEVTDVEITEHEKDFPYTSFVIQKI